jgi:BirA family biotin operon repressor/biotin-[acetyl-CoA-carboxylase] ligase
MNSTLRALLEVLADGAFHSGQKLGAQLGISRAAVGKQLRHLGAHGVDVKGLPGLGYRLGTTLELLQLPLIEHHLGDQACWLVDEFVVFY